MIYKYFINDEEPTANGPVKDQNLVSALTGHVEGSRAFTRYRTIDMDMKMDLVKILEGAK